MVLVADRRSCIGHLSVGGRDIMHRIPVEGLIPTWRLSCGHTVVSPVISDGIRSIRICIPETMPCPECDVRAEGLPNSEWSGGDVVKGERA